MSEETRDAKERRRRDDVGLPPWAKLAITVVGTTITTIVAMFAWASATFVSRVEYAAHAAQQVIDLERVAAEQRAYAIAEKGTATNLGQFDARLTRIETKIDMLLEPPRKR